MDRAPFDRADGRYTRMARATRRAGFSAVELLAGVAVLSLVAAFAMPRLYGSDFALFQAHEQLLADLRNTRADALISGDHFRLDVTGERTWRTYRMSLDGDEWTALPDPTRNRVLPEGLRISSGVGSKLEFNTRGLLVAADAATTLEITDGRTGFTRRVRVWPSGQVAP
jgi:prepilin-type N-terminal cleavage/methylation domain-containing protein